ncbi:hypothetical protein L2E82_14186 [Cichorium intybus]|uniref:Uncharacterized protein n=1 Tax=Cichorium intybus TaxID=13427 RepID=A0ACB9EYM0_CICIN|nr:hypothetical protein L2E82_14186 [Cichorium intybus]
MAYPQPGFLRFDENAITPPNYAQSLRFPSRFQTSLPDVPGKRRRTLKIAIVRLESKVRLLPKIKEGIVELSDSQEQISVGNVGNSEQGEIKKTWYRNKLDPKEPQVAAKVKDIKGAPTYVFPVPLEAESLGLPLVPPFLHDKESGNVKEFRHGVNYAIVGSSALDPSFLEPRGIVNSLINVSFGGQLAWFKQSLPYICTNVSDCRNFIEHSLFLVGEIGVNDYNIPITDGKPIDEIEPFVPLVTDTIISAVNELIDMGAKTLIVPGSVPLGCCPYCLTIRGSKNEEYDKTTGCLVKFNKFSEYHNQLLQTKLQHLRELYPNVNIIYADYYNAAMRIIRSPLKFGFTNGALRACCGSGGPYNYNLSAECGMRSATESLCDDPDTYANWDGIHFTEAANRIICKSLFQGPYTQPRFDSLCPSSPSQVRVW